jgi:hypothetical protein
MDTLPSNFPVVAAICFPEVLKRIQAELDSVVGRDRMPTFDDERSLPFLSAFIKEVTRRVLLTSCLTFIRFRVDAGDRTCKMAPCTSARRATCDNQSRCL